MTLQEFLNSLWPDDNTKTMQDYLDIVLDPSLRSETDNITYTDDEIKAGIKDMFDIEDWDI